MATEIPRAEPVVIEICKALRVDPGLVRRIVLDFYLDNPVVAYVEMYADKRILDIQWSLDGAVITRNEDDESNS